MSALQLARRDFAQEPERLGARGIGERANHQLGRLLAQCVRDARMAVAETRDRDAGVKIDKGVAVGVGKRGAVAMIERDLREHRDSLPAGRDVALLLLVNLLRLGAGDGGGYMRQLAV